MTIYLLKSIIAVAFLVFGLSAAISMLTMMGRVEKKTNPEGLRRFHRLTGYLFSLSLLGLGFLGISIMVRAGDSLPPRAIIHGFIGLFLLSVFFLKWLIVRFFRQFLRLMPALGLTVFVLSLVMSSMAGYYFLRMASSGLVPGKAISPPVASSARKLSPGVGGSAENGSLLFSQLCVSCHYPDREESRLGPGLKGLFQKDRLPFSNQILNEENVRRQITRPYRSMPAFASLSAQEIADIIAFLKSL